MFGGETPGFRFGIAARLALGFAVVGLLAATANLVAERGAALVSAAWQPARSPSIREVLSTSSPIGRRHATPEAEHTEPPSPDALLAAVADLQRASLAGIASSGEAATSDLARARFRLEVAEREFDRKAAGIIRYGVREDIRRGTAEVVRQGARAVDHGAQRRESAASYLQHLASMSARIDDTLARALTLFGRVIARQHLIELRSAVANLQVPAGRLTGAGYSAADLVVAAQAESAIARLLHENGERLVRSQGKEWVAAMQADLQALGSDREAIAAAEAAQAAAVEQLRVAAFGVGQQVRTWQQGLVDARSAPPALADLPAVLASPAPVVKPSAELARQSQVEAARVQTRHLRELIGWFTFALLAVSLVISFATVLSIVRPVRNLLRATARVAAGEAQVVVPRGGVAELDTLAGAFNSMAEEVDKARRVAEGYRTELEQRVADRTRQLQYQAFHDPLTQLPNRRHFIELLRSAIESAAPRQQVVAVYFLDLDNFKNVNDGTGHEFGDRLLIACADRLREAIVGQGIAARFGGDEFTVVASGLADELAAQQFGERLVAAFQRPVIVDQREVLISVSVGAALYPQHHDSPEALLRAADTALYRAKQQGRNRFSPYTPELLAAASVRFATEQQLRRAVEAGELELVYQPEIRSDGFEVRLVEALVRWRQADGTVIMPDVFLPVAEESGLIMEISEWVFRKAMADCARWRAGCWSNACVAINVSSRQLFDHRFAARVLEMLVEQGLPTDAIELELTENVLQTGATTIAALRRLRALGIAIALDDFGIGYSSLSSLDQLPINRVKLDRSLIAEMDVSPRSAAIVSATLQLCRDLGLEVTAEGIERPRQFEALLRFQPLLLQGFLLSRPVAAELVEETVRRIPQVAAGLLLESGGGPVAAPVINLFPSSRQRSK
jgi:diguanylate cyclase (GGDEF)-like protein